MADRFDRRRTMIGAAAVQGALSVALAAVAGRQHPSEVGIVLIVFGIGMAGAANAPASNAALPALVGRRDLSGAISLNSAQMNAARVVGPLMAGLLVDLDHPARIFLLNAATYLFVIGALLWVRFDSRPVDDGSGESPMQRFVGGVRAAKADRIVWRVLVTVSVYSLCSLVFIYQLHPYALRVINGGERAFTWVFSSFALGAALGAIAVGTVLSRLDRPLMTRVALGAFALSLGGLAICRSPGPAYAAAFFTGFAYFVVITNLSTILQERVDDAVRGRVMGLWMMGWAGLVPVGSLVGGPLIDTIGIQPVFLFGAVVSVGLAFYCNLRPDSAEATTSNPPTRLAFTSTAVSGPTSPITSGTPDAGTGVAP